MSWVQASTALLLDGMNVFDRVIKVNMARGGSGPGVVRSLDPDRVQRTIHVGGLPFDEISEETLAEYFSHVGEVGPVLADCAAPPAVPAQMPLWGCVPEPACFQSASCSSRASQRCCCRSMRCARVGVSRGLSLPAWQSASRHLRWTARLWARG